MATEHRPRYSPSMQVIGAILDALGIPPGVIRASDATLRLDLASLPTLDLTVMVPPSKTDEVAEAIAAACKEAGARVVVNIHPMERVP